MATAGAQLPNDGGGLPVPEALEKLAAPHVESFDWLLSEGLGRVVAGLEPAEIEDPATGKPLVRFWFENAAVARPVMEDGAGGGGGGGGGGGMGGGLDVTAGELASRLAYQAQQDMAQARDLAERAISGAVNSLSRLMNDLM